jgi:hypothetical protein
MNIRGIITAIVLLAPFSYAGEIALKTSSIQFDYKEHADNGELLDSEKANLTAINGFDIALRMGGRASNGFKFIHDLEYSYHEGNTDYVGSLLYDTAGQYGDLKSTTYNRLSELTYIVGLSFPLTRTLSIGGQTGFGDREWKRGLGQDILETYGWSYWMAGGRADWLLQRGEFSLYANYQEAFVPQMASSDLGLTFDLGKTSGYKLGARWSTRLTRRVSLELEYVYDYWEIERSNTRQGVDGKYYYEPSSQTRNNYAKAGFVYLF